MQRLDNEYMMRSSEAPALKKQPSEHMREMYFSSQPMELTDMAMLEQTFHMIKAESQLLYSSDYPIGISICHRPATACPSWTNAKRNILGGNAMKVFNLNLGAQELAQAT